MKNIIVGTAGHIDHGKTTLVKALTGIDADRLQEEKRRGITIDLGFAHLPLTPDTRLGFVDVPGHERFVRNMLAGAGGIDLVLLVVSAEESIKPQTREHFDICRLLGIRQGIVVITKCDLVPHDLVDLVQLEIEEFVEGSFLQGAPIVPVSASTGAGLEALRSALKGAAARVPPRNPLSPARLPIDRAFSMRGFGTVVTGTLLTGTLQRDQELEILPLQRLLRVRSLQVYGSPAARAEAGTRTAVNLPDIDVQAIQRGMVLAEKGGFDSTRSVDCLVELLPSARPLKNRAPVHFHSGSAAIQARVRFFHNADLEPGCSSMARLSFAEPAVLAPGDRFILRQFSPVVTIGGGSVLDIHPPAERRTSRIEARLQILAGADEVAKAALLIAESAHGISAEDLARRLGLRSKESLALARAAHAIVIDGPHWIVTRNWLDTERDRLVSAVRAHHAEAPLSPGLSKHDLKARVLPQVPAFLFDAALSGIAELTVEGEVVRHRSHRVTLSGDEEAARQTIAGAFRSAGLTVPDVAQVLAQTGLDSNRSQTLMRQLLKERILIRVSADLVFHEAALSDLKRQLATRRNQPFTVSVFKEWTGISRKYAVPLLEFLDREHVTLRNGDSRVVL